MKTLRTISIVLTKLFSLALVFVILVTIVSCGKSDPEPEPQPEPYDPIEIEDKLLAEPDWSMAKDGMTDYSDEAEYYDTADENVDVDYVIQIVTSVVGEVIDVDNPSRYIVIYDSEHIEHSLIIELNHDNVYNVMPRKSYEKGRYYTVELLETPRVHLYDKDPEMKEFHFDTSREDTIITNYKKDSKVHEFLLSDLIDCEPVQDVKEGDVFNLTFAKQMGLQNGDQFLIWNGVEKDSESFYGTFVSENRNSNGTYTVSFTAPDLSKIFDDTDGMDYHVENYNQGEIKDLVLPNQKDIENEVLNSGILDIFYYQYCEYCSYYPDEGEEMDIKTWTALLKNLSIKPKIGLNWPGVTFSLTVRASIPLKYGDIVFTMDFYRKSVYNADASFKLRKFWGIPYWADLTTDVTETVDTSFRLNVALLAHAERKEKDPAQMSDTIGEEILKNLWDMESANDHLKTTKNMKDEIGVDGNAFRLPILKGRWPIGVIFDIYLDLNFEIKIEPEVMFNYNYATHTVNHILEYRSNDTSKTASNTEEYSSSSHSIAIGGKIKIDVGVHLEVGLGVTGLEKWIHISIYVNLGLYMEFGGYYIWAWSNDPGGSKSYSGGVCQFTAGFYINGGISVAFFFLNFNFEIASLKVPFFNLRTDDYILTAPDLGDAKLNLSKGTVDLKKETNLLTFGSFNIQSLNVSMTSFDPEYETTIAGNKTKLFKISFKNGTYVEYNKGSVNVKSGAPLYFEDVLYVDTVEGGSKLPAGKTHLVEVPIIYISPKARMVKVDGEDYGYFELGKTTKLAKTPVEKTGEEFYGYRNKKTQEIFENGSDIVIKDLDEYNEYESVYRKVITHKVSFYDGLGNLIKEKVYRHGDEIIAPDENERKMDGYEFVKWNEEFDFANYSFDENYQGVDVKIYGVYIKKEVGE